MISIRVTRKISAVLVITSLFLASCTAPIVREEMIPDSGESFKSTGKNVVVTPVVISERPNVGMTDPIGIKFPEPDDYRFAIVSSLSQSGLFTQVSTEGASDYLLLTHVIGERILGGVNNIVLMLISYELIDSNSGEKLWSDNIFSYFGLTAEEEFIAATRIGKVMEGGVRENMNQLDNKLASALLNSDS